MAMIEEALSIALTHHQAGNLAEAEAIYRQVLQAIPDHPTALHFLGLAAYQQGRHDEAIDCMERAIRSDGQQAHFHNNLGEAYRAAGRLPEAIASYRRALELRPDWVGTWNCLGVTLAVAGKPDEAIASFRSGLGHQPEHAELHNNLATALRSQRKLSEAIHHYERAVQLAPGNAGAWTNLGHALQEQGNLDRATACFQRVTELQPRWAEGHRILGVVQFLRRHPEEALVSIHRAIQLKPEYPDAYLALGHTLRDLGRLEEAIGCYRRVLESKPGEPDAHYGLGTALCLQGHLEEAIVSFQHALDLNPSHADTHSVLLAMLQYRSGISLSELGAAHAEYERRHAAPLRATWRPHDNSPDPDRPLRLGFVSPDLHHHPVGYFLARALENLDRHRFETVCYSNWVRVDHVTARIRAAATAWREVYAVPDERLAEHIRADRIDILFDLAGHTLRNRLLVFARRPAPVQITWAGYVGTTGLQAIDYLLADKYEVPPDADFHYAERVLRMPENYVCYDAPDYAPPVGALPALAAARVTFGSFNHPVKITPQVIACWSRILRRLPHARLMLKYWKLDDPGAQGRMRKLFGQEGIDVERVELLGGSPHEEFLREYNKIDIALDPFPYSGGLTTCEALWMGVPVVTCPGETFASRHALSHLSNVGLTELVASSLDEYVDLAVELAGDLPRLAAIRAGLRERVAQSPLCDGKRFGENLMELLRRVWQEWVEASVLR